jgi:O-antigen chain-terminating methyltransferase
MAGTDAAAEDPVERRRSPSIDDFLVEPTRRLEDWQWLWQGDHEFPVRSHRRWLGRLLVLGKRLFRPLVKVPLNELLDRQRIFNCILLERLIELEALAREQAPRVARLEALGREGLDEVMRHNDALFARVDQKLDRHRRTAQELLATLSGALALVEKGERGETGASGGRAHDGAPAVAELRRARDEFGYLELEHRLRGTEAEIEERLARYVPYLQGKGTVLDLGCGRGEGLAVLRRHGIPARGVDGSAEMVARCREQGLEAVDGDLFDHLAEVAQGAPGSLGGVVSFHVIEHLPPPALDRLIRLAWRALAPGGVLVLETPNPLSLVVAARNFWLDPTHLRPVHPTTLRLLLEVAGFDPIERLEMRPFPAAERLPEIDLQGLPAELGDLADQVNRLRDRLDDLLFGCQDYAFIATRPAGS